MLKLNIFKKMFNIIVATSKSPRKNDSQTSIFDPNQSKLKNIDNLFYF